MSKVNEEEMERIEMRYECTKGSVLFSVLENSVKDIPVLINTIKELQKNLENSVILPFKPSGGMIISSGYFTIDGNPHDVSGKVCVIETTREESDKYDMEAAEILKGVTLCQ